MRTSPGIILLFLLVLVCGCTPWQTQPNAAGLSGKLSISGSSTVAPLVTELAKRFEMLHPNVRIDVQAGGSGKGIADTRKGIADIGMASRTLTPGENDVVAHTIAIDGICLIVHQSNQCSDLSNQQVVDIYTDKINNWSELGGSNTPIHVVHKAEGRATLEVFLRFFGLHNPSVKADVVIGDNEHGIKTVAGSPGSIGYVSIGAAEVNANNGSSIRLLPVNGVLPDNSNVSSGKFPLTRPLNLVTTDSPSDLAKAFITFCQSEEVHDLVIAQYFVPASE